MKIQIMLHQHQRQQYNQPPAERQRLFTGVASWYGLGFETEKWVFRRGGVRQAVKGCCVAPGWQFNVLLNLSAWKVGGRLAALGLCLFVNRGGSSGPSRSCCPVSWCSLVAQVHSTTTDRQPLCLPGTEKNRGYNTSLSPGEALSKYCKTWCN